MRYCILLLVLLVSSVKAETTAACEPAQGCATEHTLHLSWALGYGQRSNPLHGGEVLPLVILPDIYYYAEHWFFDNGKLGSSWALNEQWQLSLVAQFNQEKGHFQKWFGGNAFQFSSSNFSSPSISIDRVGPLQASVREIRKRPTAFDAGLQLDGLVGQWLVKAVLWQDISNTYQGQHASVGVSLPWQQAGNQWQLSGSLLWKSAKLIDTYYGIDNNEPFYLPRYNGKPSWQPELRLSWQRPVSERVSLLAFVRYLHLDDAMTDSPLVRTDNVTTWFLGISYRMY